MPTANVTFTKKLYQQAKSGLLEPFEPGSYDGSRPELYIEHDPCHDLHRSELPEHITCAVSTPHLPIDGMKLTASDKVEKIFDYYRCAPDVPVAHRFTFTLTDSEGKTRYRKVSVYPA